MLARFSPFTNPEFEVLYNGDLVPSNKGGSTSCFVELPMGDQLQVKTFHMVAFHFFDIGLDDVRARNVLREVGKQLILDTQSRSIVQADFNIDAASLTEYLPELFAAGYQEVVQSETTTPREKALDHIVYKGLVMDRARVIRDCRTDHYPIVTDFRSL
jgi:endonuclease/exonuclease/phosphatase (EEP) superfamily protein YafD